MLLRAGLLLMSAALAASLLATPHLAASLPYVLMSAIGCAAAVAASYLPIRKPPSIKAVLIALLVCAGLFLLWTLLTARWPVEKMGWLSAAYAALPSLRFSLIGLPEGLQPNQLGGVSAVFVGCALAVAFGKAGPPSPRGVRNAAWSLTLLGTAVVVMTGSRAALAGLLAAATLVLALRDRHWLLLPVGLAAAIGVVQAVSSPGFHALLLNDEQVGTNIVSRLDIWASSLHGMQDHLFTGIGLGVFNEVVPLRYPYETVGMAHSVSQAHNIFLDIGLSLGLPGLLAFLLLLASVGMMAYRAARYRASECALFLALISSFSVFMVFGITDSLGLSSPSSVVLWLWLVLFVYYYRSIFHSTSTSHS
jgi:O-antigen ligase